MTLVAVSGATGTVGRHVVRELLDAGAAARALSRRGLPDAGAPEHPGLQHAAFSFTDPATWPAAFADAEGLFLMLPPGIGDVRRTLLPAVAAARDAGVRRVAFLSVLDADRNRLIPHRVVEDGLAASGLRAAPIRAGNFMQNLVTVHAADIRRGTLVLPAGRARMSYVDARDVAAVAARCLADDRVAGRPWSPTGPRAITHAEVAATLSAVLGRPVRYRGAALPRYWLHARRTGLPPALTAVTSVLYTLARFGLGTRVTADVEEVLGRPATEFRRFAEDHAAAWSR